MAMAKPDVFRILGCVALVTLILVIAVKMSKQCMRVPPAANAARARGSPSPSTGGSASSAGERARAGAVHQ